MPAAVRTYDHLEPALRLGAVLEVHEVPASPEPTGDSWQPGRAWEVYLLDIRVGWIEAAGTHFRIWGKGPLHSRQPSINFKTSLGAAVAFLLRELRAELLDDGEP